tara:strand:- start:418 stop:1440 length:1023 start_codon:yes stop_codon:yes gene_type:complete
MTKPVIAVATMQLLEKEKINLNDLIDIYLPEFSDLEVLKIVDSKILDTIPLKNKPTIKDLLLHTAGFSYNFLDDPLAIKYDQINLFGSVTSTLEEEVKLLSTLPLLFEPSTKWLYSVSMDVLARILEIVEGKFLQKILHDQIFEPLEMNDTSFCLPKENLKRLMHSYEFNHLSNTLTENILEPQKIANFGHPLHNQNFARGGHGLYSTAKDFMIFVEMLHSGKTKDGQEIISKNTIDYMKKNHLNEKFFPIEISSVATIKDENYSNDLEGYGWGLGFRTLIDLKKNNNLGTLGEFGWSGAASTYFLVDHTKNISAVLMTQVLNGDINLKKDFYKFIYTHY